MATNLSAIKGPLAEGPKPAQAGDRSRAQPLADSHPRTEPPARAKARASGLPLIGGYSVGTQLQILIGLLIFFLLVAAACVYFNVRLVAQNALYSSTATEMQMLSQRIANSAQQAVQGSATAFSQLGQSRDQFVENLKLLTKGGTKVSVTVAPSPRAIQPALQALDKQWGPVQKNIALILAQEKNLIELRQREETIARAAPQLPMLALELINSALDARERYGAVTYAHQLHADAANFDFINAVRLLSTDDPNPQVALQLGSNTRQYLRTLKALLGEGKVDGVSPISDEGVKRRALALDKAFAPFAASVQAVLDNMQALADAKQASRDIFGASEGLLKSPLELAAFYQQAGELQRYYVWGTVFGAILALGCLVLFGTVFVDDSRRRAGLSERQNRTNQDAILRLLNEISNLADGDLRVRAKVTDDITGAIADSINYAIDELRRLVTGINTAAQQVTAATQEAHTISGQLLQAAQKQSAGIQGTGQAVVQMANSINTVSSSAAESAVVAKSSLRAAEKGAEAAQIAIRGMNDIRDQIQETSKRIKRLGESSQEIGEIVQLISDITEQTNVLALNAAIQAASAGEAGRGFTVVAEEVQRLAERSAEATKHISAIVKSIQRDTQDAVAAMERSTQGVVEGTRTADEADRALREIYQVSNRLAELIGSISNATQQQAKVAKEVALSMKEILAITQLTTDGTKRTASATEKLAALASDLKNSVSGFKVA
jgi:twitching motility protein PilJ